ncbi:hypothetical protein BpHYR1_016030 [Brachionus plicatilis]|uniref:Ig-like domain-containing protein n=1 Tax=Brachionus plicatilis TaxID=10195 RepID=A0A3M7RG71_BRAPC|nr:hypothetical protein BpHYR1_016030 [Brachionus plicatilis]
MFGYCSHIIVNVSDPVTLECRVSGEPRPRISWLKDYHVLDIDQLKSYIRRDPGQTQQVKRGLLPMQRPQRIRHCHKSQRQLDDRISERALSRHAQESTGQVGHSGQVIRVKGLGFHVVMIMNLNT